MNFDKVFQNPILVEKILENVSQDYLGNLNLRAVNKLFNSLYLQIIRRNYRRVKLENIVLNAQLVDSEFVTGENYKITWIYFNYCIYHIEQIPNIFRFLRTVANVRITEVIGKHLNVGIKDYRNLHDSIHVDLIAGNHSEIRTFIGIENLCDGCENCLTIMENCEIYGTPKLNTLLNFKKRRHFKELIINDLLIEEIGIFSNSGVTTKKECFEKLDQAVIPHISCEKLVLCVHEARKDGATDSPEHLPMPREVFDAIIQKWKPKSIEVKIVYKINFAGFTEPWNPNGHFTPFRFTDLHLDTFSRTSSFNFNHVEINLSESWFGMQEFKYFRSKQWYYQGLVNSIGIIRSLLNTQRIFIKFSHWRVVQDQNPAYEFNLLWEIIQLCKPTNLSVDVDVFMDLDYPYSTGGGETFPKNAKVLNGSSYCCHRILRFEGPRVIQRIGRSCRFENTVANVKLTVNFFITDNDFMKLSTKSIVAHESFFQLFCNDNDEIVL